MGSCCIAQGAQLGALWQPRGVGWFGIGKEVQGSGGHIYTLADSHCCMTETNTRV